MNPIDESVMFIQNHNKRRSPVVIDLTGSPIDLTNTREEFLATFPSSCWDNFIPGVGPVPAEISNWNMSCGTFPTGDFDNRNSFILPPNEQSRRKSPSLEVFHRETLPTRQPVLRKTNTFKQAPVRRLAERIMRRAPIAMKPRQAKGAGKRQRFMETKRNSQTQNKKTNLIIKDLRAKLKKKDKELKAKKNTKKETKSEKKKRMDKKEKNKKKKKTIKAKITDLEKKVKKRKDKIEKMNKELEKLAIKEEKKKLSTKKKVVKKKKKVVKKKKKVVKKKKKVVKKKKKVVKK